MSNGGDHRTRFKRDPNLDSLFLGWDRELANDNLTIGLRNEHKFVCQAAERGVLLLTVLLRQQLLKLAVPILLFVEVILQRSRYLLSVWNVGILLIRGAQKVELGSRLKDFGVGRRAASKGKWRRRRRGSSIGGRRLRSRRFICVAIRAARRVVTVAGWALRFTSFTIRRS